MGVAHRCQSFNFLDTSVMPNSLSTPMLLWLDPEAALGAEERNLLDQAGWQVRVVHTLDDLAGQATLARAGVIRLSWNCDRLKGAQQALADAAVALPLFARVDRDALELAVEATHLGADGVLAVQDWRLPSWQRVHMVLAQLQRDARAGATRPEPAAPAAPAAVRNVVFVDPASQHLLALAQRVAQADVTALLVGPTGSGKEVLARVLHEASARARAPFVALNCAAMPDNLIEDLLFGHDKGAFTGAHREHKGLFEQAQGGTIFLDEIGEMPMHLQSKLLRVLQERQLTRLGGHTPISLNVRVVAATNKDLRDAIARREFREDLYYRIATFRMTLLPLRERPGDIMPLAMQCMAQHGARHLQWRLHPQACEQLLHYNWPGNVRELENVIRRAMVLCSDGLITASHLMFDDWTTADTTPVSPVSPVSPATVAPAALQPAAPALPPSTSHTHSMPGWPWAAQPQAHWTTPAARAAESRASSLSDGLTESLADMLAGSLAGSLAEAEAEPNPAGCTASIGGKLQHAVRLNEHQLIMATIAASPSRNEAAKRLGISPRTLRYKLAQMREMGLAMVPAAA